jgi:hypothetical protein
VSRKPAKKAWLPPFWPIEPAPPMRVQKPDYYDRHAMTAMTDTWAGYHLRGGPPFDEEELAGIHRDMRRGLIRRWEAWKRDG